MLPIWYLRFYLTGKEEFQSFEGFSEASRSGERQ